MSFVRRALLFAAIAAAAAAAAADINNEQFAAFVRAQNDDLLVSNQDGAVVSAGTATASSGQTEAEQQQQQQQAAAQLLAARIFAEQQQQQHQLQQSNQSLDAFANLDSAKLDTDKLNVNKADENAIYLLGLFDIRASSARAPFKCGAMDVADGGEFTWRRPMQNMQAFLWAIEQVNADASLLPGVRLGSLVMDTCSSFLRTNQQLANLLHDSEAAADGQRRAHKQVAAIVADSADAQSIEATASMASALGVTTFVTQSRSTRLGELARKYRQSAALTTTTPAPKLRRKRASTDEMQQQAQDPRLIEAALGELLGIGRMHVPIEEAADASEQQQQQQRLLMVRMAVGNELLAEAIATFVQQMAWDLVSLVYDDEPDMVDLHDELARQLFARQVQLAADEQIAAGAPSDAYDKLLVQQLARKTHAGARVVVTMLGVGSARALLDSLHRVRSATGAFVVNNNNNNTMDAVNSLLWITVSDREPYYARATDSLGVVAVSSSASLDVEFKRHYEQLPLFNTVASHTNTTKWWPEYARAIMQKHARELDIGECASSNASSNKCKSLTLGSLVNAAKRKAASAVAQKQQPNKLAKYLAGGWEHNGMDVINAVLAAANALEAARQALCPSTRTGLCAQMRALISSSAAAAAGGNSSPADDMPTLSELVHFELMRSSFQLADGRTLSLDESHDAQASTQLKLYNLRYLMSNSIGFVKFGTFDAQADGLVVNASKARHYSALGTQHALQPERVVSLDKVRSSCTDDTKCIVVTPELLLSNANNSSGSLSDEEALAARVNSLFKLDHPSLVAAQQIADASGTLQLQPSNELNQSAGELLAQQQQQRHTRIMLSATPFVCLNRSSQQQQSQALTTRHKFNVIVLLPLHKAYQSSRCAANARIDSRHAFQQLAAVAFAGQKALRRDVVDEQQQQRRQIELTTTLIDYCNSHELAEAQLRARLAADTNHTAAVLDFDSALADKIDELTSARSLLHLTIDSSSSLPHTAKSLSANNNAHLRVSLLPSKANEIQALVGVLAAMPEWRLVHLVYTDAHHYRDEFVRRANEAGVCVNKLIWIPGLSLSAGEDDDDDDNNSDWQQQVTKTRALFASELYAYDATARQQQQQQQQQADGLNATRVIVVLASQRDTTNKLILEAASESMLDDYVWLASHEWLQSVELAHERATLARRLPRQLVCTKHTSGGAANGADFREYLASLTPAVHAPLPTDWFDEFWQQTLRCRLPASMRAANSSVDGPVCSASARLHAHDIVEDERVRYVIDSMAALHAALADGEPQGDSRALVRAFKREYATRTAEHALPHGYQLVHRLLPSAHPNRESSRRQNSRKLSSDDDAQQLQRELVRVGVWKHGELTLNDWTLADEARTGDGDDSDDKLTSTWTRRSLAALASVQSQCVAARTCELCNDQVTRTRAYLKQEEAKLRQSESAHEPQAISTMMMVVGTSKHHASLPTSIFDAVPHESFEAGDNSRETLTKSEDALASASSLFNSATRQQLDAQRESDVRRAYNQLLAAGGAPSHFASATSSRFTRTHHDALGATTTRQVVSGALMSALSVLGIVCILLSMAYLYPPAASGNSNKLASGLVSLDNVNDYFLLTGLLMLFAINVAYLLPATLTVCYFRRVGLAASHMVIFSSILVKVVHTNRRAALRRAARAPGELTKLSSAGLYADAGPADPIEDGIEVTFESLPQDLSGVGGGQDDATLACVNPARVSEQQQQQHDLRTPRSLAKHAQDNLVSLALACIAAQVFVSLVWLARAPPEPTLFLSCWHCASPTRSPRLFLYESLYIISLPACVLLTAWLMSVRVCARALRRHANLRAASLQLAAPAQIIAASNGGCQLSSPPSNLERLERALRDAKSLVITNTLLVLVWLCVGLKLISSGQRAAAHSALFATAASRPQQSGVSAAHTLDTETDRTLLLVYGNIVSGTIIFAILFVYRLKLFAAPDLLRRSSRNKLAASKHNSSSTNHLFAGSSSTSLCSLHVGSSFRSATQRAMSRLGASGKCALSMQPQQQVLKFNQTQDTMRPASAAASNASPPLSGEERLRLHLFSSYGSTSQQAAASATTNIAADVSKAAGGKRPRGLFGRSKGSKRCRKEASDGATVQRRRSNGSCASSTATLFANSDKASQQVSRATLSDSDDSDTEDRMFPGELDNVSCASSVASSSTSQLHGNDLYPIDCSIQLDSAADAGGSSIIDAPTRAPNSLHRRSLRLSIRSENKLSAVQEEVQQTTNQ